MMSVAYKLKVIEQVEEVKARFILSWFNLLSAGARSLKYFQKLGHATLCL
jgi:hypothetical protein